jgi:ABC-type uncharacterized transport system auxiliary subunit
MKKVFAILAVAAVVSACTTTPTDTYDKRVMLNEFVVKQQWKSQLTRHPSG